MVEENPLFPIHCALIRHNVSVFASQRSRWFAAKKGKDRHQRFDLFAGEVLELHDLQLLARKEFEQTGKLTSIKSPIDVSKTSRFNRRRARDACLLFPHCVKKIQRFAAPE